MTSSPIFIRDLIRRWSSAPVSKSPRSVLPFQVHRTNVTPSLQCFLIEDRTDHVVPFTATHYLTDFARVGKSPKTAQNVAYSLAYLYSFAKNRGLDLNRLVANGDTLKLNLIGPLVDFIRSTRVVGSSFDKNKALPVSKNQTNKIAALIAAYLRWGLENYSNDPRLEIENLMAKFRDQRFSTPREDDVRVLDAKNIELLEEAFDLDSSIVWSGPLDKLRNHCIFGIAYETGARISEILALQVGDVGVGSVSVIHIVKRGNDPRDPRSEKPSAKTFGRTLPISKRLHTRIAEYIQHRPRKNRNVYLFLSHHGATKGEPLSLRRAHALWKDVARKYSSDPRVSANPRWHDIRHTALYRFYKRVKHLPNAKEILKQAAGHVSDSVFLRYHRLAIMEDVQEHLIQLNTDSYAKDIAL